VKERHSEAATHLREKVGPGTFGRRSESKVIPAKEPHMMPGPQALPILRNESVTTKTKVISPEAGTGGTPSCCNPRTSQQARADKRRTRKFSFIESIHSTLSCQQWRKHYFLAKNNRGLETKAGYRLISIPQSEFIRAVAQPGSALPWSGRGQAPTLVGAGGRWKDSLRLRFESFLPHPAFRIPLKQSEHPSGLMDLSLILKGFADFGRSFGVIRLWPF